MNGSLAYKVPAGEGILIAERPFAIVSILLYYEQIVARTEKPMSFQRLSPHTLWLQHCGFMTFEEMKGSTADRIDTAPVRS